MTSTALLFGMDESTLSAISGSGLQVTDILAITDMEKALEAIHDRQFDLIILAGAADEDSRRIRHAALLHQLRARILETGGGASSVAEELKHLSG